MGQILCSTGALLGKANHRDYRLLSGFAEKLDCDGFEFMMYSSWYEETEKLVAELKKIGLSFPVMHCEKHLGEAISKGDFEEAFRLFDINVQIGEKIGAEKLVIHLWDGMVSDSNIQNNISAYENLSQAAEDHGLDLLVENVVCNQQDPMTHWYSLHEKYPGIHFIFDTKMADFHGQLELLYDTEQEWLWKEDHIRHYHINDYAGGYMDWSKLRTLPIGKGHIDFERFFDFVKKTGYDDTFTVEATAFDAEGHVDLEMLNECFMRIRQLLR